MTTWQLQEAKGKFREVVKRAQSEGPQEITVRGEPVAVLISGAAYARLGQAKLGLVEFLRNSPLNRLDLDIERAADPARKVDW